MPHFNKNEPLVSRCAAGSCLLWMMLLASPSGAGADQLSSHSSVGVIAAWKGGTVSQGTYASWLRFQGKEAESYSQEEVGDEVEALLLVETLAAAALERHAEDDPALRFALLNDVQKTLVKALRRDLGQRIEIDDAMVEEQMRAQPELSSRPRKIRLRNIFKSYPAAAGETERAALRVRMAGLLSELQNGADFVELATRESDSQTRFRGGLIGNIEAFELRPEMAAIAGGLEAGELSAVIETEDGLTILRCDEILQEEKRTLQEVRQMVVAYFRRQEERKVWQALQDELLVAARPQLDLAVAADGSATPETVVASFTGARLTRGELLMLLASRPVRQDPAALDDQRLRELLENWVVQVAGARRARLLGLDQDPTLRERLHWRRLRLLAGDELGLRVRNAFEPLVAEEIRAYFEAHPEKFQHPPHFDLSVISIELPEGEEKERYRWAEEVRGRLATGEVDFEVAARDYSEHPTADVGGALGWLSRRQLAGFGSQPLKVITALRPGEISELVQRERNLFIFQLHARREGKPQTWEVGAPAAEQGLAKERIETIKAQIEKRIRSELEVRPDAS